MENDALGARVDPAKKTSENDWVHPVEKKRQDCGKGVNVLLGVERIQKLPTAILILGPLYIELFFLSWSWRWWDNF